jgi:hypothetical protein
MLKKSVRLSALESSMKGGVMGRTSSRHEGGDSAHKVGNAEQKRLIWRRRRTLEGNIEVNLKKGSV